MNIENNTVDSKAVSPRFVKTNIPNLVKLEPMETYYGRCKVNGKTIRQSLETKDFKVVKSKLLKWLIDVRGRVHANEGDNPLGVENRGTHSWRQFMSRGWTIAVHRLRSLPCHFAGEVSRKYL